MRHKSTNACDISMQDLPGEIWKDIPGYENVYMASNQGRVKSYKRKMHNYVKPERILKLFMAEHGYLYLSLTKATGEKTKHEYVHRIVAMTFIENPEGYEQVNHKDSDKTNNTVENLEWCTRKQNIAHFRKSSHYNSRVAAREKTYGDRFVTKVLNHKDEILKLYDEGYVIEEITTKTLVGRDFITSVLYLYERLESMGTMKKSILQAEKVCYITGRTERLHKHHIYGGSNRKVSDSNGFWVYLLPEMHNLSNSGVHYDKEFDNKLKRECQAKYEETHSRAEFMKLIGRNYL